VEPWPEPSADKKKCVASSANLNQFNSFESNGTFKPPPAASKYSYSDAAFASIGNLELFDPAAVGTSKWGSPDPSGLQTRAKSGSPRGLYTQARSGPRSGRQTRAAA
jgi:hypothetical protein